MKRALFFPGLVLGLAITAIAAAAHAEPLLPASDAEVVERLPASGGAAREERRARRLLAQQPDDVALALRLARAGLERSRSSGDPRHAGLALAALRHWSDPASAPPEVLLLQATLDQHLHEFDAAARKLETLLQRRPRDAQGWLTLATVRRVQGRYGDADVACRRLAAAGTALHAAACAAENDGLRGRFEQARAVLQRLAATPRLDGPTRAWLLTTRAELEQRAGDPQAAETAWRAALQAAPESYALLGCADLLLAQGRPQEALVLLQDRPASDAVLLRRAIGGDAPAAQQLRERIAQAGQRPGSASTHGREQALFALQVEHAAPRAVALARQNLQRQREPVDLWVLAAAAHAAGDRAAAAEARQLAAAQGLVDHRFTKDPS